MFACGIGVFLLDSGWRLPLRWSFRFCFFHTGTSDQLLAVDVHLAVRGCCGTCVGRVLARDQAFVAKRRLVAGEPARAALSEAFR